MTVSLDTWQSLLRDGLSHFAPASIPDQTLADLGRFATELLKWNDRVNLTAITEPSQVVDKHLLDALAVLPELDATGQHRVLDLGAGAGIPGLVWAVARPQLEVTLVDSVGKKVAFMKAVAARLGLAGRVHPVQAYLRGAPGAEGISPAEVVVSRAFRDLEAWLRFAASYVAPGGVIIAMTGRPHSEAELERVGRVTASVRRSSRHFQLPYSGDPRGVSVWQSAGGG